MVIAVAPVGTVRPGATVVVVDPAPPAAAVVAVEPALVVAVEPADVVAVAAPAVVGAAVFDALSSSPPHAAATRATPAASATSRLLRLMLT